MGDRNGGNEDDQQSGSDDFEQERVVAAVGRLEGDRIGLSETLDPEEWEGVSSESANRSLTVDCVKRGGESEKLRGKRSGPNKHVEGACC